MFGYYNRILTIDLTTRSVTVEPLADQVLAECFGGKGLATRLLLERNEPGVDPLSPGNHLIFSTGSFCGGQAVGRKPLWGIHQISAHRFLCRIVFGWQSS